MRDQLNFLDIVDMACRRPGMFMIEDSLEPLETMAIGYEFAIAFHAVDDDTARFNASFRTFLEGRYGWSMARGWSAAIGANLAPGETAIVKLGALIAEYRTHLRDATRGAAPVSGGFASTAA
jgi:hypothetical protein